MQRRRSAQALPCGAVAADRERSRCRQRPMRLVRVARTRTREPPWTAACAARGFESLWRRRPSARCLHDRAPPTRGCRAALLCTPDKAPSCASTGRSARVPPLPTRSSARSGCRFPPRRPRHERRPSATRSLPAGGAIRTAVASPQARTTGARPRRNEAGRKSRRPPATQAPRDAWQRRHGQQLRRLRGLPSRHPTPIRAWYGTAPVGTQIRTGRIDDPRCRVQAAAGVIGSLRRWHATSPRPRSQLRMRPP
mmetsp:Transcript_17735/g.30184  ORF Transcript_17735/g.30184 Transcript_17735/m.30184 type:complete len:252 (+) Transcript_17735:354-1109(+)